MPHKPTKIPFVLLDTTDEVALGPATGGQVLPFTAGATLLVGDVVYLTTTNTVNKTNVIATVGTGFVGVVVGGAAFASDGSVQSDDVNQTTLVGQTAATVGQRVLVQISGVANVVAGAAVVAGVALTSDTTTSGRVLTNAAGTFGQLLGNAVTAAAGAASVFKMYINHR